MAGSLYKLNFYISSIPENTLDGFHAKSFPFVPSVKDSFEKNSLASIEVRLGVRISVVPALSTSWRLSKPNPPDDQLNHYLSAMPCRPVDELLQKRFSSSSRSRSKPQLKCGQASAWWSHRSWQPTRGPTRGRELSPRAFVISDVSGVWNLQTSCPILWLGLKPMLWVCLPSWLPP